MLKRLAIKYMIIDINNDGLILFSLVWCLLFQVKNNTIKLNITLVINRIAWEDVYPPYVNLSNAIITPDKNKVILETNNIEL